jgi:acetyl-CoA carboxylase biotin carboxyl carrier protein
LDLKELKDILQILDEHDIAEFELEEQGVKLRIRRAAALPAPAVPVVAPAVSAVLPMNPAAPAPAAPEPAAAPVAVEEAGLHVIKSPIVGTFYRSADPSSPVFVEVGDRVKNGQVVCIIEAMKLMNEIESEVAGEIVKIHTENGKPVQYGDPLFSIRT